MSIYDEKGRPIFAIYAFIFLFLVIGIITGGNLSYRNFEREFHRQAEKQISSIAELKVNGLANWRSERLLDAEFFYQNQSFSRLVEDYFGNPGDAFSQAELITSMRRYQSYDQYDQVSLLDADGKNRLVVSDNLAEPVPEYSNLKGDVTVCLASGEIMLLDFRRDTDTNGRVSISILVPIFAEQDQRPLGVFAIRVDPETYLYPFLNQWPVPSDTAETLLVRSADGDVLFLNQLRFMQDAALNLRIPLTSTEIPAVQAALGRNGVMEGLDYRGEPVLADVRPVPDSPWFLVSKVDMIEVYMPLRERLWQTLLIVAMAIFISGLALFAVWRQQRVFYYRTKAETTEALRASEEKFRKAFLLSPDSININRLHDGMYVSINDGFTRITGYASEEVIGKTSVEMNIWANPQDRKQLVDGLLKEGKVENLEFRFRMKNGEIRDGLMSASFFELDGTPHIINITRDITDVRLADQKMREAQLVLENSPVILFRWKAAAGWPVELVSENVSQFGYTPEDFLSGAIPYASIIHPDDLERVMREVSKYSSSGVDHFQQEYRIVTRDGQVRWTDDRTMTERDAQGNVMYYQGTVMDITERKRTEEELRRQTALFRSLFERSPEAITIVDREDCILNVNQSFEALFGYQEAEIQGRYVNDLIVSESYKDEAEGVTRISLGEGQVVEKETVRCTKDGRLVDVSMVGYPIFVEGHIIGGSGIYRDITERKRAEERLEQFFSINLDLLCIADLDGNFIKVNKAWESILGYSAFELEHRKFLEFVHPDDMDSTLEAMSMLGRQEQVLNFVNRYRCMDGSYRFIEWRSQPLGNLIYAAARDITDRIQAEKKLQIRESYLSAIIENQPGLVWLKDTESRFLAVNRAFAMSSGIQNPDLLLGKTDFDIWPVDLAEKYRSDDAEVMRGGKPHMVEEPIFDKGEIHWFETFKAPIFDQQGVIIGTTGYSRNITDRKQTEEKLLRSEEQYRYLFENNPHSMWAYDLNTMKFLAVNDAAVSKYGYSRDEFMEMTIADIRPPEELERLREDLKRPRPVLQHSGGWRHQLKNGTVIDVEISSHTLNLVGREAALVVAQDVTERKRAEEALKENEAIFSSFLEHSPVYVFFKDKDIRSLRLSKNYEQMLGMPISDLLGKTMDDLFPSDLAKSMVADDVRILNEGRRITVVEELNGRIYETTKFPVLKDGEPYILAGFTLDITERRQAEEALKRQNNYLLALQETALELDSQLDLDVLLGNIVRRAGQIIGATSGFLDLVDVKTGQLVPHIGLGALAESLEHPAQLGEGVAGMVWQTGQPLVINDYDNWSGRIEGYTRQVLSSIVGVPLISSGRVLGVFGVGHEYVTQRTIAPESVEILTQFSRLATIAIENARLFATAQEEINERKMAEEALRESQTFLDSVYNGTALPTAVLDMTENGKLIYVGMNMAYERAGGVRAGDVIGRELAEVFINDAQSSTGAIEQIYQNYRRCLQLGETVQYEESIILFGQQTWWLTSLTPLRHTAGQSGRVVCTTFNITERKLVEEELRITLTKYKTLFECFPLGISVTDQTGNILEANPIAEKMLGMPLQEHIQRSIIDPRWRIIRLDGIPMSSDEIPGMRALGEKRVVENMEMGVLRPDDDIAWLSVTAAPLPLEGYGVVITYADITARKKAEEALRESEELYRRMNQNSPLGMHFYTLNEYDQLIFVGANPAADMLLGMDNSQFVGKSIEEAFPPLVETEVPRRYRDAAARGIPWSTEQISYTDRQIIGAFEVKVFQTTPRNMVAMFADITARKKAEEALRESEVLYRKAIEASNSVPYRQSYHVNGVTVSYDFIGEGIRQITGYGPEEFGEALWDSITEERILLEELAEYPFDEAVERVRSGLNPVWKCEHRIRARDGSIHWVFESAVELCDEKGLSRGSIGLFQDITARKQAEEEILNLNAELEQRVRERTLQLETTNKELEAFSYSVSHDLRAPLRGIDGWSQALVEDYYDKLDEQGRQYIERVRSETQRMGRLIDDMLKLSRLSRAEMNREQVDLSDLARTIVEQIKRDAPHRQVEFRVEAGLTAEGDANLLEVVLINLLGNAFKFTSMRADALIEFGQTELEGRRVFFVRDNGAGFEMAYAQKLFGAFQRMHKSSEFPGTGVGLAIVQRIIRRHGGQVWAEAEPGHGAAFYFTLG